MGDLMHAIPFGKMISWTKQEYQSQDAIFGIRKDKIFKKQDGTGINWFGEKMGSVIGPAAGPHSQLAQNIVASYLAGSRFIELKTVQKMDGQELRECVAKPCINAQDECYNVEWSTELTVQEAFDEYVKAWFTMHVLMKELQLSDERDFIFNMSVGYDLEGIKLPKINNYIEGMKDASNTPIWKECVSYLDENISEFKYFTKDDLAKIEKKVCSSITISTLHGCPPDEIERIARYLLEEKKLTTFVKCNPTLLGYKTARGILDPMGFDYISFDDHHFNNDLQFSDAVAMFKRLKQLAADLKLGFGVKLTNTFPVQIKRSELPGEEMYMSGRSLLPLTLQVATNLSKEFNGELPISYSGGIEAANIDRIFNCGIYPITMATTLLKPGGYERFSQIANILKDKMAGAAAKIDPNAVESLTKAVHSEARYNKASRAYGSRKTESILGLYDCFKAPCKDGGCPIEQQIPEYLKLIDNKDYDGAFNVIAIDNTAPAITSVICNHNCQSKCTRMDYESSIRIRDMKNVAVTNAQKAFSDKIKAASLKTQKKAVVIGAGPAGIAAALFLRRNGMAVSVKEKLDRPYGIVEHVIPEFRIASDMIKMDYDMALKTGVEFEFGVTESYNINDLRKEYDYVIIATGAWEKGASPIKEGDDKTIDALELLRDAKANGGKSGKLGKRVAIIGGGDVAMDCARVAARNPGTDEAVIVYRRTREFMPAENEEINMAIEDGVKIMELLAPTAFDGKELSCGVMTLGDWDASGRRGIVDTGEKKSIPFDTVVVAVGARVKTSDMSENGLKLNARGAAECSDSNESSVANVYVAGDCRKGPSTIVNAIADAKAISKDILAKEGLGNDFVRASVAQDEDVLYMRKGLLHVELPEIGSEGKRCLACDALCEICNDVCPNRANVHVNVDEKLFGQKHQVLHLDGMCNECGNCSVFCPHTGDPYRDKVTVFWSKEEFEDSKNVGFLSLGDGKYLVRKEDGECTEYSGGENISKQLAALISVVQEKYPYYLLA